MKNQSAGISVGYYDASQQIISLRSRQRAGSISRPCQTVFLACQKLRFLSTSFTGLAL
jgi:hypothetical protein